MKKLGVILLCLLLLIGMLPQSAYAAQSPAFDQSLTQYLGEISTVRGFEVTKDMLEASMAEVGQDFSDFKTFDEVRTYFGEVIHSDYSNINHILEAYQLTMPGLEQLLADYGEALTDYIFIDDLEFAVYFYSNDSAPPTTEISGEAPVFDEAVYAKLLASIDLTNQEIQNLTDYLGSMEEYFSDPIFLTNMNSMQKRLEALSEIKVETMTAEQAAQFASWFQDFFNLLRLHPTLAMIKDGKEIPLTISEAIQRTDFLSNNYKIALYSTDSKFLADFIIDQEKLGILFGNLDKAVDELGNVIGNAEQTDNSGKTISVPKTEKGGKLPKTAANDIPGALLGILLLLSGLFLYKKATNEKKNTSE